MFRASSAHLEFTLAAYRQATRNSYREWRYHMLLVYNYVLLKMSTWCSKHVGENSILWINNNQCIKLVTNIQSIHDARSQKHSVTCRGWRKSQKVSFMMDDHMRTSHLWRKSGKYKTATFNDTLNLNPITVFRCLQTRTSRGGLESLQEQANS